MRSEIPKKKAEAGVLSQKFVEELSPQSGRQRVAHGVSRGSGDPTLTPVPSPAQRDRGAEGGVRVREPRAYALGYSMPPLTGLLGTVEPEKELCNELLTPDTRATLSACRRFSRRGASFHFPVSEFCFLVCAFNFLFYGLCFKTLAAETSSAEALIQAGHFKRARAVLEPRVAANPRDAEALSLLSCVKVAFGDLDSALGRAQQAVAVDAGNSDYLFQLADVYGEMAARASIFAAGGLARKFKGNLDASLSRNPKNLDALDALMQYSFQAPGMMGGDKAKARAIAEQLLQINPVRGYLAQAELAKEAKDYGKVEENFRKAVQADPKNYEARTSLARFYIELSHRDINQAETQAREAVRLDPTRAKGYSILASVLALERRWSELETVLAAAERSVPDDLTPHYEAASALVESAVELPRAEAYARKYLTQEPEGEEPDAASAHRLLGLILEKERRTGEALSELEIAVQMNPRLKGAKDDLARVKKNNR